MGLLDIETPEGQKILAVAIKYVGDYHLVCYAQNKLFTVYVPGGEDNNMYYDDVLIEHCVVPEYDNIINEYSKIDEE